MRISQHEQNRRVAIAEAKVKIFDVFLENDLSNFETLVVLAEAAAMVANRAVTREIREDQHE